MFSGMSGRVDVLFSLTLSVLRHVSYFECGEEVQARCIDVAISCCASDVMGGGGSNAVATGSDPTICLVLPDGGPGGGWVVHLVPPDGGPGVGRAGISARQCHTGGVNV